MRFSRLGAAGWVAGLLLLPALAGAQEWRTILTGPITVQARTIPGTALEEVRAEGSFDAQVQDVQSAILDAQAYPRFMPYVKEVRFLRGRDADDLHLVYTRVAPPFMEERDYVVQVTVDERVAPDGSGSFRNHWVAQPNAYPRRQGAVRVVRNEGTWHITPLPGGRSHVSYRFMLDPGGWIPSFAMEIGHKRAVEGAFHAVEREAQARAEKRRRSEPSDVLQAELDSRRQQRSE